MAETPLLPVLHSLWLGLHVVLALLGYAALTLTFCAGVMYLMQERQLKSKRPGTLYHRLPSLMLLDEVNARALVLGFPLLTQGIITGIGMGETYVWVVPALESHFVTALTHLADVWLPARGAPDVWMAGKKSGSGSGGRVCGGSGLLFCPCSVRLTALEGSRRGWRSW